MGAGEIILWVFVAVAVGMMIFAVVSEIKSGHTDYVIFCLLLIVGLFILIFATSEMSGFVQRILRNVNIFVSGEAAEEIATAFILAWLVAAYLFYKSQKKK